MKHEYQSRTLDSPFAESVTTISFVDDGEFLVHPDNHWDFVIFRRQGTVSTMRTGMTTKAVSVPHNAGDEILTVSFSADTFMPAMPGYTMKDMVSFLGMFGRRDVRVGGYVRELPTFENAEGFVDRLVRDGTIEVNDKVTSMVRGRPCDVSDRTLQRHFLKTTGLTYKNFTQIERAQNAVKLLRAGGAAVEIALALGYADQAHMINSLRRIMGQTPGEIARAAG